MTDLSAFKAYDIRGEVGRNLDADLAQRIGRAFAEVLGARQVVLGRDCRLSSPGIADAVARGLVAAGVEVIDLGLCGTEEVYAATGHLSACGGIEVTASHNPAGDNGMKLVKRAAAPLDPVADLGRIKALVAGPALPDRPGGRLRDGRELRAAYVDRVLSFVDPAAFRPLRVLVNAGNGAAGPTFDAIAEALAGRGVPLDFVRLHEMPDGTFPNGVPNPLLPENQPVTGDAVCAAGADLGVAWDGDFDRCFLFDAAGRFVPGEHVVGLLAAAFLEKHPGETIVHDPRVVLNTRDIVAAAGGRAVAAPTGHVHLKRAMRDQGAVYGGEMSAHHYFRDFFHCDSGMIPWLLTAELMGRRSASLADLVGARIAAFPSSGEINFRLEDADAAIARVLAAFAADAVDRDEMDGLSLEFPAWRFNLRRSNTEPLVRLNVETRGDGDLLAAMTARLTALIRG